MPLKIVKDSITSIKCDAVVVFCNEKFLPIDKIGREIHKAAGAELAHSCAELPVGRSGDVRITPAYKLGCKQVIHAVMPKGSSGSALESKLRSAYTAALRLAYESRCARVALALAPGAELNYPTDKILRLAHQAAVAFLSECEMSVSLVATGKTSCIIDKKLHSNIQSFLTNNYNARKAREGSSQLQSKAYSSLTSDIGRADAGAVWGSSRKSAYTEECVQYSARQLDASGSVFLDSSRLDSMLKNMDKGFRDTLFYYIDKKGLSDVECYKRSNVDKKTFSKIKCNADYRPSKVTAVSFAVGLHLDMIETEHLLSTAGMCLSHSSKFDVIIEYFITSGTYETIFDVNEVLYQFDQSLLGV